MEEASGQDSENSSELTFQDVPSSERRKIQQETVEGGNLASYAINQVSKHYQKLVRELTEEKFELKEKL